MFSVTSASLHSFQQKYLRTQLGLLWWVAINAPTCKTLEQKALTFGRLRCVLLPQKRKRCTYSYILKRLSETKLLAVLRTNFLFSVVSHKTIPTLAVPKRTLNVHGFLSSFLLRKTRHLLQCTEAWICSLEGYSLKVTLFHLKSARYSKN